MNKAKHPDTRKILIVDDNPDIHHDFTSILDASTDTAVLDRLESEIFGSQDAPRQIESYHYRLGFATQGLLGDERIGPNRPGMNFIIYEMMELEHIYHPHRNGLTERLTRSTII